VLTTASSEHAIEGYRLGAVDYLLKPFTAERVEQCVQRLLAAHRTPPAAPEKVRIVARDGRRLLFIPLAEVLAFESESRLSFVHTEQGRFDLDLSLTAMESALVGQPILRVHRSWLVNLAAVRGLDRGEGEMMISLGRGARTLEVPVARERATEVRERLIERAVGLRR
jgi:DNA-binding LytR/AlgR family response regulator